MKTKNEYIRPLEEKNITGVRSDSPAHIKIVKGDIIWDLTHAIDFKCDEGTPVRSSANGVIFDMKTDVTQNYDKMEPPPKEIMPEENQDGNFVVIKHENNEFSIYSHFQHKKILVKLGQKVKAGDVLGYSGHTGWSIKPHVHFMVFNLTENEDPKKGFTSLEIRWKK